MTDDLIIAKKRLSENSLSCAFVLGEKTYESKERGVFPLIRIIDEKIELRGYAAADKVVGKAAAALFVLIGVSELYAEVITYTGYDLLIKNRIPCEYGTIVKMIKNRKGNGECPMEEATAAAKTEEECYLAVKDKIKTLSD